MPSRRLLAVAAVLALAAPAADGAGRDRCNLPDARTVALTAQLRVLQSGEDGFYYGCARQTGRRTLLWAQDDVYLVGGVRAAAGRFAAYGFVEVPACKADCPPGTDLVEVTAVVDVRTGRKRTLHDGVVSRVLLRPSGAVAWLAGEAPDLELSVWEPGGQATAIATGDIHTLRARRGRLSWLEGGRRHAVAFDARD